MTLRIAVIGPGRVGTALARGWHEAGAEFLGFVGRRPEAVRVGLAFVGAGRELATRELQLADVVVVAVGDAELPAVATVLAADPGPGTAQWIHVSGFFGLDVFRALAERGAGVGSLHPVCPFPDAAAGHEQLADRPAVICGDAGVMTTLRELVQLLGMRPVEFGVDVDRTLYHAACALAANGLTALFGFVERLLVTAAGAAEPSARDLVASLMRGALDAASSRGAADGLSGPIVRGDHDVVAQHLAALESADARVYRTLMELALTLADVAHPDIDRTKIATLLREGGDG